MRVAITGATGFIGRALVAGLHAHGCAVIALTRNGTAEGFPDDVEVRQFSPEQISSNSQAFDGADAVVHLAGESVDGRWTPEKKRRIYDSRILGTRAVVTSLAALARKPSVLVCASATGFYGSRADDVLTESSPAGDDFLAHVVTDWEHEAEAASQEGIRTVCLRTGIVLGPGGALGKMAAPFRFGMGGPFGSGKQFVPWIHLHDIAAMYLFAIENANVSGPVNAVAPDYATGARFAWALGNALARPAYLPAPAFALRAVLGEFADTILASQLVLPTVAEDAGFRWRYPNLEAAMIASASSNPQRKSTVRRFEAKDVVHAPLERVFAFFSAAQNLERITPPSLHFAMLDNPERIVRGSVIAYRLRVHGASIRWKTLISRWEPPNGFVDVQLHGPYASWRHEHTFTQTADGVVIGDAVEYVLPLAPLGNLAAPLVEADIRSIFDFRRGAIASTFLRESPCESAQDF